MRAHLGSFELQHGLALGFPPRRLLILLQGQVGVRGSTRVGISRTLPERERKKERERNMQRIDKMEANERGKEEVEREKKVTEKE